MARPGAVVRHLSSLDQGWPDEGFTVQRAKRAGEGPIPELYADDLSEQKYKQRMEADVV
jgi:hypothetical protein